ncbi:hypothetical protein KFK09_020169 [Dendrobium nobile]|uniref:Protein TIFY n=1 Tax=Dendrobium nobile TaxID=94219 RepID=A0A8T3ARK4_DENNO|nr:hypothetical protein KFK09_020169 [Dendrobium nobile]
MRDRSMTQYLAQIKSLVDNIAAADSHINSEDIILYILNGPQLLASLQSTVHPTLILEPTCFAHTTPFSSRDRMGLNLLCLFVRSHSLKEHFFDLCISYCNSLNSAMKIPSSGAPLTIFYNGRIKVYERVKLEEAKAIVHMAAKPATYATRPAVGKPPLPPRRSSSVAAHPWPTRFLTYPKSIQRLPIHRLPGGREIYWTPPPSGQQVIREIPRAQANSLPMARSRSLNRFLEARRAR